MEPLRDTKRKKKMCVEHRTHCFWNCLECSTITWIVTISNLTDVYMPILAVRPYLKPAFRETWILSSI